MNTLLPIDIGSDELYIIDGTFEAGANTAQKKNFSVKDFLSKCDQIRSGLICWRNP